MISQPVRRRAEEGMNARRVRRLRAKVLWRLQRRSALPAIDAHGGLHPQDSSLAITGGASAALGCSIGFYLPASVDLAGVQPPQRIYLEFTS